MSHEFANLLLNKVREGFTFPLWLVNQALELTGDLAREVAA